MEKSNSKKVRTINAYFGYVVAILSVITALVYYFGFGKTNPQFFDMTAVVLPIVGLIAYVVLSLFKPTAKLGALIMWVCTFGAFLVYVHASYMHLAEVFYAGFNAETFKLMERGFIVCLVLYLLTTILANIVIWGKMTRTNRVK